MNKEEIDDMIKKVTKQIDSYNEVPTYEKALWLDMSLSIFRLLIGSDVFDSLHYFKMIHADVIKHIEKCRKEEEANEKED